MNQASPTLSTTDPGRENVSCYLCGRDDFDVFVCGTELRHGLGGEFRLVKCRNCHLVYLNPRPTADALNEYYPPDYSPYVSRRGVLGFLAGWIRRREVAALKRALPPHAEVLEVGCAAGDLLVPMRDAGFQVTGIELSDQASTEAREQHHLDVHTGTLADAPLGTRTFDAVIMRSVIEHLPDPKADLLRAANVLRPGGLLILKTDNVDSLDRRIFGKYWHGFDFPRHLTLFSRETLTAMVADAGLQVTQVDYSLVPTHWVTSLRYAITSERGSTPLGDFVSLRNPLLLGAGVLIALIQKLAHDSGRFGLVAVKPVPQPPVPI